MKTSFRALWILVLLISLIGCSTGQVTHTFKGENENWSAALTVHINSNSFSNGDLTTFYKGDISDFKSIKHFEVGYEAIGSSSKITMDTPPENKTTTLKFGPDNGAKINKDDTIKVTIVRDDKIEVIDLKR
jgi:hypothetical protein